MESNRVEKPFKRRLYDWEQAEAQRIFGPRLQYDRVWIHENAQWPNLLDRISRRLRGMPARRQPNAVTLGNHLFFPVRLPVELLPNDHPQRYKIGWLMHELTHAYQYQRMGWGYLIKALTVQVKEKDSAYQFGDADGLKKRRKDGWTFHKFNPEAQGNITRSYYERLCVGKDVSDWEPYIHDIQDV